MEDKNDIYLKELFRKELPQAPRNPWFVKKVLNRLPDKSPKAYTWVEYLSYLLSVIGLVVAWFLVLHNIDTKDAIGVSDIVGFAVIMAMGMCVTLSFISPWVKKWLLEP